MDLKEIVSFTDYFIICTGTSDRMLDALAKATIEDILSKLFFTNLLKASPFNIF